MFCIKLLKMNLQQIYWMTKIGSQCRIFQGDIKMMNFQIKLYRHCLGFPMVFPALNDRLKTALTTYSGPVAQFPLMWQSTYSLLAFNSVFQFLKYKFQPSWVTILPQNLRLSFYGSLKNSFAPKTRNFPPKHLKEV